VRRPPRTSPEGSVPLIRENWSGGLRRAVSASRLLLLRCRPSAATTNRILALRMLRACGVRWMGAVGLATLATAILPSVALVVLGRAIGEVPRAARDGLGSAAGHQMMVTLVVAVILYAGSLMVDPIGSALNTVVRVKIDQASKRRLITAVSGPVGIAHLEDPALINKLDLARGSFMSYAPADAPLTLAGSIGSRLSGVLACAVIGFYTWWLGLALFIVWTAIRRPIRRIILDQVKSFQGEVKQMRRAWYFLDLATKHGYAKEVRVFGLASWVIACHQRHWHEGMAASWRGTGKLIRRVALLGIVVLAVIGTTLGWVAWTTYHHEATLTQLAIVLSLLPQTMTASSVSFNDISLEWMISALPNLWQVEREMRAASSELAGTISGAELPARSIRFEQVTFRYPRTSVDVLADMDLELPLGQSTALIGLNGAGKTTLVKLLCRLHDPTAGRILVDGTPLGQVDPEGWRHQVAVVFQDFNHYPMTAAENVAMGAIARPLDRAALHRAAQRAGAREVVDGLPGGWDTILSREYTGGVDLSGGQWQRIALARALYAVEQGARLLILDEPTAWLDVRAEAAFFDSFLALTRGVTSLIISHRFATVRQADRIVVLDGGRITEQGTHTDLLAADGTYAALFRVQAAGFAAAGQPS
jgi:ATP-binding cassette, subfamily B, bacterial